MFTRLRRAFASFWRELRTSEPEPDWTAIDRRLADLHDLSRARR